MYYIPKYQLWFYFILFLHNVIFGLGRNIFLEFLLQGNSNASKTRKIVVLFVCLHIFFSVTEIQLNTLVYKIYQVSLSSFLFKRFLIGASLDIRCNPFPGRIPLATLSRNSFNPLWCHFFLLAGTV